MKYANVIIDIAHEKLDKTFQYKIPVHLQNENLVGTQVTVPFGNGNRTINGFVIEVSDKLEFDENRLKEIIAVNENKMLLESQLIQLAYWIKKTYGSTMIQALKIVLPVKNKIREAEDKKYVLNLSQEEAEAKCEFYEKRNAKAKLRLLQALMKAAQLDSGYVKKTLAISPATIKSMLEENVIIEKSSRIYRNPVEDIEPAFKIKLNEEQIAVVDCIMKDFEQHLYKTYLLHGITGSGKTEVYVELIEQVIAKGKQAIVLIPEIALTYQTVNRFTRRFGERVSVLHSKMSQGERYDQMQRAKEGRVQVMIGPRSALFTPFTNLGLIIIDEEHESSYKSENVPKYHARETAIERARLCGASVLLGSATPSVDAYYKAEQGEYELFELHARAKGGQMADVYIEDMREELKQGNRSILGSRLHTLMEERLRKKEQIMLFLNRRGYAGFVSCRSCGLVVRCPHCDVSLSLHKDGTMRCHYCGYSQSELKICPDCGSKYIGRFKAGTQQVEQFIQKEFPNARIMRMDTDTTKGKNGHEQIVKAFANEEADILIGTQMIVKGHDFPKVTLVGVLAADLSLNISSYTSSERTFQLLTQAAGRAGRGSLRGEVVIQTYDPQHYSIICAAKQDYKAFYEKEIKFRELLYYPPVGKILEVFITSESEEKAFYTAGILKQEMERHRLNHVQIIGPAPAAVARVQDRYRQVLYFKSLDEKILFRIRTFMEHILEKQSDAFHEQVQVQFDYQ